MGQASSVRKLNCAMRAKAVPLAQRKPVQATRLRQGVGWKMGRKKGA